MRTIVVGLLCSSFLLATAGSASAATAEGSFGGEGWIRVKTTTMGGVAKKVYRIDVSLPVTCEMFGQQRSELAGTSLYGGLRVRKTRRGYHFRATNKEFGAGGVYTISGYLNRRGTRIIRGTMSVRDLAGGEDEYCSANRSFNHDPRF